MTTPYSTVAPYMEKAAVPLWVPENEVERIASYGVYDDIYWNVPGTFKLVLRGTESLPIYVPNARTIIDTTHRYTATNPGFSVDPAIGAPEAQAAARAYFQRLFTRERFWTKFLLAKREGLRRGDWLFHVIANSAKPAGKRISIYTVDPRTYFPVFDSDNLDKVVKVHLAEEFIDRDDVHRVKRQTYWYGDDGRVWSETIVQDFDEFKKGSDIAVKREPAFPLDARITHIPVYHIRNQEETSNPFGSSELRGFERLMSAVNQSVSDEDIALALEGLGMYATDAGKPVIQKTVDGRIVEEETDWVLGPGRVVEIPIGAKFERIAGISSIQPQQDHIAFLISALREAAGITDAAMGKVDVTIAESGVSLLMQLAPMLARVDEKDMGIGETLAQMFYDLTFWTQVYENLDFTELNIEAVFGDKIPPNRRQVLEDTLMMLEATPPLISVKTAHERLSEVGYEFSEDEVTRIANDAQARQAAIDAAAGATSATDAQTRIQAELNASGNNAA